jgi:phosphoglycolate phosphatase-like HAD superfamily hydrolase
VTAGGVDAVIFSWGSLVDTHGPSFAAIREVTVRLLGYQFPRTTAEAGVAAGLPPAELFGLLSGDRAVVEQLDAAYTRAYLRRVGDGAHVRLEAREALAVLRRLATLAVLSSEARPLVERALLASGLAPLIAAVVCEDEASARLPSPVALVEAMERCAARPPETLFVVSRPVETIAGRDAGLTTIAVDGAAADETGLVIDDLRQLVGLVAGVGSSDNGPSAPAPPADARSYSRPDER